MVAIPLVVTFALHANPPDRPGGRGNGFFYLARFSGLVMPVAALQFMSRFLLVVVVAMFAGDAIASEASWGNLRAILTRPVRRGSLLAAKLGIVGLLTFAATAFISLAGLVAGIVAFGWHPVDLPFLGIHQSTGELLGNLARATGYVAAGRRDRGDRLHGVDDDRLERRRVVCRRSARTSCRRSSTASTRSGRSATCSRRTTSTSWNSLFGAGADADMVRGMLLQLGYVVVFCGVAWWWFRRKDVLS